MTTTLHNSTSTSTSNQDPSFNDGSSLLSNLKLPTTVLIQPPSSAQAKPTLLTKRYNPAELGDLLLKKIKSQNSHNNSNDHSPLNTENQLVSGLNCLENNSMLEEVSSPSIKSYCDEPEVNHTQTLAGILMPQRSNTAPLAFNTFNIRHAKADSDPHKQVQHALEVLQKKLLMEQQASVLKDLLLKLQTSQEPLIIPPLLSTSTQNIDNKVKSQEKKPITPINPLKDLEDDHEIFYGPVEYPLLSMAPSGSEQKGVNLPSSSATLNNMKTTKNRKPSKGENGISDSLSATRAETQKSESDAYMDEESPEDSGKRRKGRKMGNEKRIEEKAKARRQRNDGLLSPIMKTRKITERKKNKWQTGENANREEQKQILVNNAESKNDS